MYVVHCDASIEPFQPYGLIAWAFIVRKDGEVIHKDAKTSYSGPKASNNVGEYQAVIAALLWLNRLTNEEKLPVLINSDSKLIINQCSGKWNCNAEGLIVLRDLVKRAIQRYGRSVTFHWISREQNKEADALSRTAYNKKELEELKKKELDIVFNGDDVPW